MQTKIPCVVMRGGTSKAPYFLLRDLPAEPKRRDEVLLSVMGSPDLRQIDGIGGGDPLTSKVAMVGPPSRPDADVDYLFAQVAIERAVVDTEPTCGNILSGVGAFAIEAGLVPAAEGTAMVRVHNVNTGSLIESVVQTPGGRVEYEGDTAIDGVPGTAAPVVLNFMDVVGSKTGALLPTGCLHEDIEGVAVTCMDVAMPMVIMRAKDLGKTGHESKAELDEDTELFLRMESIRRAAALRMGLGHVSNKVVPKLGLLSEPAAGGTITSRYFVPQKTHAAHAVSGAICVATCAVIEGTVADGLGQVSCQPKQTISIEHPSGIIDVVLEVRGHGAETDVVRAGTIRTCRRLFEGNVFVPASVWKGPNEAVETSSALLPARSSG